MDQYDNLLPADGAELLLGGEVYNYHHVLNMKPPGGGGSFRWHQDFGYWYSQGYLRSDLARCMIACDRASKENGCLKAPCHPCMLPLPLRKPSRVQVVQAAT